MGNFDNKKNNKFGGDGFRGGFRPAEKHKAVCDDCKKDCEVPFKPTQGKPVYCRDCYAKRKPRDNKRPRY